jgi:hypothetical protein
LRRISILPGRRGDGGRSTGIRGRQGQRRLLQAGRARVRRARRGVPGCGGSDAAGDEGDHALHASAEGTDERIDVVDPSDELGPSTALGGLHAEAGRCNDAQTQHLVVDGDETLDFSLPLRTDSFGYSCHRETPAYLEANTVLPLSGDDNSISISLPFPFTFYGQTYNSAFLCTNGLLSFTSGSCPFTNSGIPNTGAPNAAIYPYWDDLFVDGLASVRSQLLGSAPNRSFVIEWRNVTYFGDSSRRVDFEVILHENGQIETQYRNIADDGRERGNSATLGIENETGTVALQYSLNEAVIFSPVFAVLYRLPPSGFVQGTVTDGNDHLPVAGATVRALQGGNVVRQATTNASGFYRIQLLLGTYTIDATATNYSTASAPGVVLNQDNQVVTHDFVLLTARGVRHRSRSSSRRTRRGRGR